MCSSVTVLRYGLVVKYKRTFFIFARYVFTIPHLKNQQNKIKKVKKRSLYRFFKYQYSLTRALLMKSTHRMFIVFIQNAIKIIEGEVY